MENNINYELYELNDTWKNRIISQGVKKASEFLANPYNWHIHTQMQNGALRFALNKLGWIQNVIENQQTGHLIDGHDRVLLAYKKNDADVPYILVDLNEEEEKLAIACLDPITTMAQADKEKYQELVNSLSDDPEIARMLHDITSQVDGLENITFPTDTGIDDAEIPETEEEVKESEGDRLKDTWGVAPGQLWTFPSDTRHAYEHRLFVGDCTEDFALKILTEGNSSDNVINGVFTSPPYAQQRKQYEGVPPEEYIDWFFKVQQNIVPYLSASGSFFINIKPHTENGERNLYVMKLVMAMRNEWGWSFIDEFCWERICAPGSWPNRFKNGFEPVYHFARGTNIAFYPQKVADSIPGRFVRHAENINTNGYYNTNDTDFSWTGALPSNVIPIKKNAPALGHPAAFPVELPEFFIKAFSVEGDIWLDPFAGSGSVAVAAERNARLAYMIEKDPKYAAITIERMARMGLSPMCIIGEK